MNAEGDTDLTARSSGSVSGANVQQNPETSNDNADFSVCDGVNEWLCDDSFEAIEDAEERAAYAGKA